ncbi:unnamed protein product [Strongylus vulgaris]|uniref:Uncharacterized protein n=1 Tax=Strongylus vulgaris TaxID=40348 RepID=A0A3P7JFD3_STRVU|nr:unnamed protein product [Strongylus vulgaris]
MFIDSKLYAHSMSIIQKANTAATQQLYLADAATSNLQPETSQIQLLETRRPYIGKKEVSKRGKHPVLVNQLAETSYSFALEVRGEEFLSDPCDIQHVCEAKNKAEEIVTRVAYLLKKDPKCAGKKPLREWTKMIAAKENVSENGNQVDYLD